MADIFKQLGWVHEETGDVDIAGDAPSEQLRDYLNDPDSTLGMDDRERLVGRISQQMLTEHEARMEEIQLLAIEGRLAHEERMKEMLRDRESQLAALDAKHQRHMCAINAITVLIWGAVAGAVVGPVLQASYVHYAEPVLQARFPSLYKTVPGAVPPLLGPQ